MSVSINNSFSQSNNYSSFGTAQPKINARVGDTKKTEEQSVSAIRSKDSKEEISKELRKAVPGLEFEISQPKNVVKNTMLVSAAGKLKSSASALANDPSLFKKTENSKDEDNKVADKEQTIAKNRTDAEGQVVRKDRTAAESRMVEKDRTDAKEKVTDLTGSARDNSRIEKKLGDFVKNYNDMLDSAQETDNTKVLKSTLSMTQVTAANEDYLAKVGIRLEDDNKLSIDSEAVKKADESDMKSLFSGKGSYADTIDYLAKQAIDNAKQEVTGKAYNAAGAYANPQLTGSIYDIKL